LVSPTAWQGIAKEEGYSNDREKRDLATIGLIYS